MNDFYDYEFLNSYQGSRSAPGTVENAYIMQYFMRSLYQRAMSIFRFNIPDVWNVQYFKNVLFRNGFIGIVPTAAYGVIPQICTLRGYGIWLQPTDIVVAQPLVSYEGKIGTDCELIKITPDYRGIWDIIEHYALMLSNDWTSLNMAIENSKISKLAGAKNKAAQETLKVIAEKISAGDPLVVFDNRLKIDDMTGEELPIWTLSFDSKDYHVNEILESISTIINMFDREIGIPAIDQKRERYITDEVQTLNADSCARINTWKECLKESFARTNDLFSDRIGEISFTTIVDSVDKEVDKNVNDSET